MIKRIYFLTIHILMFDVANDPYSAANTAVPAEFASRLAVERFICNAGHNKIASCQKTFVKACLQERNYAVIAHLCGFAQTVPQANRAAWYKNIARPTPA